MGSADKCCSRLHGTDALVKTSHVSSDTPQARQGLGIKAVTAFTLAHLSDPHLAPLPEPRLNELLGKRALGYFNWQRNRKHRQSRDVADALVRDLKAERPDHIAVTGDLVNIALEAEFTQARDWLNTIGAPRDVTLVPGNHDAYVSDTYPRCARLWFDYMRGDSALDTQQATFPFVRRRGPLLLIGASSAIPTAPFMATGTLGQKQCDAIGALLAQNASADCFRVLLIHHPLRSRHWHKRLTDAPELLELLRKHGAELVLHGHDHKHSLMWFDGPAGRIPAVGVPSASAIIDGRHDPAAYNLFRVVHDGSSWRCDWSVRGLQDGREGITALSQQQLIGTQS
jgi:3',5'-cyclic AMP phosphodiesterase CpdA